MIGPSSLLLLVRVSVYEGGLGITVFQMMRPGRLHSVMSILASWIISRYAFFICQFFFSQYTICRGWCVHICRFSYNLLLSSWRVSPLQATTAHYGRPSWKLSRKTWTMTMEVKCSWYSVNLWLTNHCIVFWRDDKIRHLSPHLISQVPVCLKLNLPEGKRLLQDALCALMDNATDDVLLKSINLDLLMHTRSEDVQVRLYALVCSKTLWQTHGGKLLGKNNPI